MSAHRPVAVAAHYQAQTHPCIGTHPVTWGLDTLFRGWALLNGVVCWTQPCDTQSAALELACLLYDRYA